MNRTLINCGKMIVKNSPIEGWGVFATDDIKSGEILEEVPFVLFPRYTFLAKNLFDMLKNLGFLSQEEEYLDNLKDNLGYKLPEKYYFKWFPKVPLNPNNPKTFTVLPLGYGPIYNSSNSNNNAGWKFENDLFIFRAEKDIKKGEEIKTFYGYFLGQDGTIFNCDTVFGLALDYNNDNKISLRSSRFSTPEDFQKAQSNPVYIRLAQLMKEALNNELFIRSIHAILPNGKKEFEFIIPSDITLTSLYQKIQSYKQSPINLISFIFYYLDDKNNSISQEIIFQK